MLVFAGLVLGCSPKTLDAAPPTIQPARPAESPPVSTVPAGAVRAMGGSPHAAIFDQRTAALVLLGSGSVTVLGAGQTPSRVIALPGPASALTGDGAGNAYLSTRGGYFAVDLSAGHVSRAEIGEARDIDFTAIARRADHKLVLGTADGTVYTLSSGTTVANRSKIVGRIDSLVAQGNTVITLDRGQTLVTTVDADGTVGQALRAGQGATMLAADPLGRVLVTDTRGGQLLVYGVDPLILRQAYPVKQSPYGVAGSRRLAWVSQTAANLVIGYDLSTGIPVEKVRYPTVRQPNTLAFDDTSDTLYVVSGSGAGVQVIEHAAGPR
ncbi:hypothetical protein BST20_13665 [Mycobacterium branderi]|uniref:Lipoprotein LppL n=1 Tax=Mycobacterium branderi TaxID=43348 RepID=A0AA91LYE8_9MYCO|nr:hypothetical protein BST20_13665 [Mycobacterium branderi]